MIPLRIKFRKFGPVRFIGHLDMMRFFQKAIRRAEIDVSYTSGYSPHQKMSFAAPLGVGIESNGEYLDIEVNSVTDSKDMITRLNTVSVPGIEILSINQLPPEVGNAMASVAAAQYSVCFKEGREPSFDYESKVEEFLQQEEILIEKKTKKGSRVVDLKTGILSMSLAKDPSVTPGTIHMLLDASSEGNIKPQLVMEAFVTTYNDTLKENALHITREETYTTVKDDNKSEDSISKDDSSHLVPLEALGRCIL